MKSIGNKVVSWILWIIGGLAIGLIYGWLAYVLSPDKPMFY